MDANFGHQTEPCICRHKTWFTRKYRASIHTDETPLSVAKRPESAENRKKSYVYVYASSYYDHQIHIYDFHEARDW